MTRRTLPRLRARAARFLRAEDGSPTVEFALCAPVMVMLVVSGFEISQISMNHMLLERALDMTVRDIRLGTGAAPQHDQIKAAICKRAAFLSDCENSLRLEMVRLDPRNWSGIETTADCTDKSDNVTPVRNFTVGQDNDLMILRACAKQAPFFPTTGLGASLKKDGNGDYALVSTSVFVQEPR